MVSDISTHYTTGNKSMHLVDSNSLAWDRLESGSFRFSAPSVWNSLPQKVRISDYVCFSISHLFVSDQWSIWKKKKEIDNKRRNKSNKSSTQYSLENSIAKSQKMHEDVYIW